MIFKCMAFSLVQQILHSRSIEQPCLRAAFQKCARSLE
jgi:hypothetical protein